MDRKAYMKEYHARWYRVNKARISEQRRLRDAENKARYAAAARKWKAENPQKVKAAIRRWRLSNPDSVAAMNAKYRDANGAKIKGQILKKKYGITPDVYGAMVSAQEGRCLICGEIPSRGLRVDHDHNTGRIRGLLCDRCNIGIGHFRDNPKILERAAAYLCNTRETSNVF